MADHHFQCRVYYEDTDLSGLVYHANYLRFVERARSEWVRSLGIDQAAMRADGRVFVVARIEADFRAPARYDDLLDVVTTVEETRPARLVLRQIVSREGHALFSARVTVALIGPGGRPERIPERLRA